MRYDGILFDLDGTLWDSSEGVALSWKEVLDRQPDFHRALAMEDIYGCMGLTEEQIEEKLFSDFSPARQKELFDLCIRRECEYLRVHGGKLFPMVPEVLAELSAQAPLFIVSNCESGYIECFLEAHRMHSYFQDFECIGNTGLSKAENIRLVAERNGIKNPVYVGDTIWDKKAADGAGVPFIFAAYGFGNVENCPRIEEFAALREELNR